MLQSLQACSQIYFAACPLGRPLPFREGRVLALRKGLYGPSNLFQIWGFEEETLMVLILFRSSIHHKMRSWCMLLPRTWRREGVGVLSHLYYLKASKGLDTAPWYHSNPFPTTFPNLARIELRQFAVEPSHKPPEQPGSIRFGTFVAGIRRVCT